MLARIPIDIWLRWVAAATRLISILLLVVFLSFLFLITRDVRVVICRLYNFDNVPRFVDRVQFCFILLCSSLFRMKLQVRC